MENDAPPDLRSVTSEEYARAREVDEKNRASPEEIPQHPRDFGLPWTCSETSCFVVFDDKLLYYGSWSDRLVCLKSLDLIAVVLK